MRDIIKQVRRLNVWQWGAVLLLGGPLAWDMIDRNPPFTRALVEIAAIVFMVGCFVYAWRDIRSWDHE